jgi:hypothetical protein
VKVKIADVGFCVILAFWSLADPWMLVCAGAAAIPVLIHLLSRRTRTVTSWAAMIHLQAAVRKHARRLRLEQWLLLATRVLIVILLAVALAEPGISWLPVTSPPHPTSGSTHTVLVLDGSYSMSCQPADATRWERAKELAREQVAQGVQGDGFSLLVMADPPRTIVADVAFDRDDMQQEIDNLALTHGGASLEAALDEVTRLIRVAATRHPRLLQHQVCWFTDLGRTTWDDVFSDVCRRRVDELAETAVLTMFDVGSTDAANLAVTRLGVDDTLPVIGDRITLEVELQNYSDASRSRQRLELLVDGRRVAEQFVDLPAIGRAAATFDYQPDTAGEHVFEARLSGDVLEVDDHRWLSLPVRESLRVLCVEGKQAAAKYVALALAPAANDRARIQVDVAPESALVERELADYDAVWLCDVGRFARDEALLLHRFVERGGALIIAPGDQTQTENYNRELGGEASGRRVLPARLGDLVGESAHYFDPKDYEHPVVAPFRGHPQSGLLTAPVWRYFKLTPFEPDQAKIALAFDSQDPAIVEQHIGRGRSLLLATAVSLSAVDRSSQPPMVWTAWPTWPSFPPLVHTLLESGTRGRARNRTVSVGEPLTADLPRETVGSTLTVTTPTGREERVPVRVEGTGRRWFYNGTETSGVYRAAGEKQDAAQLFAVNVDTVESDLSRVDRDALPEAFGKPPAIGQTIAAGTSSGNGWPLFRALLCAVLLLVLAETVIAWRFGGAAA